MMWRTLFLFLLFSDSISGQVTFVIDRLPENTPEITSVFISGDFENWSGGKPAYELKKQNGKYTISLPKTSENIAFKFTRGSWNTVETAADGSDISNRTYRFKAYPDTVFVQIANWSTGQPQKHTTARNVHILSDDFYMPQLGKKRRIWLYVPPDYTDSKQQYPVIYMHDGQNLFDAATSFSGEWEVDETLNRLFTEDQKGFIVLGIDNGGKDRLDEYSPWKNKKYGGGEGAAYVDFIVQTLKPYIDKHYRTLSGRENTAIFGSSMGGLISYYALLKYPAVFGKAGVFSPSFWFSDQIFEFTKKYKGDFQSKIYFLAGDHEGVRAGFDEISQTVTDMQKIKTLLIENGFPSKNIQFQIVAGGKHNEKLWREHFGDAVKWLFKQ